MSPVMRWGSLAVASSLLIAGLAVPANAVEPSTDALEPAPMDGVAREAADSAELARASGAPVPIDALTTPTEQTRAMPDGSFQYEVSNAPVRVAVEGSWVPVDTDLRESDGWLVPEATVAPVRFATGGNDILAEVQTPSGDWITEVWPHGDLPAPTIDDATATYREVLPGVDLKLTATEIGMTTVYVVKNEKAAKSDELRDLGVDIEGATLSKTKSGGVRADGPGAADATSAPPLWWDASHGGTAAGPGGDEPLAPVVHEVAGDRVSMDVAATVASEDINYPLYVDPDWSTGQSASWYTDAKYPNQGYLATGAGYILRAGADAGGGWYSNAFFQFPISALRGKQILGATMNTTQLKALFCAPSSIEVRAYGPQSPGFSWNGTAGGWGPVLHNQNPGNCSSPAMAVGWNVTGGVQSHVGANMDIVQFAITYPGGSNTSRRHFDWAASLIVNYNSPPNTPTDLKFVTPAVPCGTAAAPAIISATDVTVSFTQTDPDPGNVDTNVYLHRTSDLVNAWQHRNPGLGAQGTKTVTFNGLVDGQAYAWRARGSDWVIDGASYSAWCYFTIDRTGPAVPGYTAPATPATVGMATTVKFTTAPADRVAFIAYTVTPTAGSSSFVFTPYSKAPPCGAVQGVVRIVCPNSSGVATATVVPTDGVSTVLAIPYDVAGNPGVIPGTPAGQAGRVGASFPLTAVNDPNVSFNLGHAWITQAQPSPLGDFIEDLNTAAPVRLVLGADASRTAVANPKAPSIPLSKPVLAFRDPTSVGNVFGVDEVISHVPTGPGGVELILCTRGTTDVMVGTTATCDAAGMPDRTPMGYTWGSAAATGWPGALPLTACDFTDQRTEFFVIAVAGESCEHPMFERPGYFVADLGYVLPSMPTGPDLTKSESGVLNASASFTVAAWMKPASTGGTAAVSTDSSVAGFELGATSTDWRFCLRPQTGAAVCAIASRTADADWTHLSGVWDSANGQIRLYKRGVLAATAQVPGSMSGAASSTAINIGASVSQGAVAARWGGQVADPAVFAGVATAAQLGTLADGYDPVVG